VKIWCSLGSCLMQFLVCSDDQTALI